MKQAHSDKSVEYMAIKGGGSVYHLRGQEAMQEILAYLSPGHLAEAYPQQSEALWYSDFYVTLSP